MASATDLMVRIYGHDVSASKALKDVGRESENVSGKLKNLGKVAAVGFAAAGAAAVAFGASAVKAAIEDEKSQKSLAKTLQNTVHATKNQIAASETFISKLQLTYGVADDKLRPAFATLTRATKDLGESQKLTNLALDISAATGKDLETVSLALAKAHNGNIGALTRLGIPLDKNIIKTKDFNGATEALAKTFGGAAKANAETFSGKMAILQQHLNEAKEQIGTALLPILTKLADYILKNVVPNIQAFVDGLTGKENSVSSAAEGAGKFAHDFGEKIRGVFTLFKDNIGFIKFAAEYMALFWGAMKLASGVSTFLSAMNKVIGVYRTLKSVSVGAAMAEAFASEGASIPGGILASAAVAAAFGVAALNIDWSGGGPKGKTPVSNRQQSAADGTVAGGMRRAAQHRGRAVGGSVSAGTSYMVGENGPELFTPSAGGMITRNENLGGIGGMSVHIHVAGSVIHEKDLAVTVRDNIAQLMRRRGLNPAILGV